METRRTSRNVFRLVLVRVQVARIAPAGWSRLAILPYTRISVSPAGAAEGKGLLALPLTGRHLILAAEASERPLERPLRAPRAL